MPRATSRSSCKRITATPEAAPRSTRTFPLIAPVVLSCAAPRAATPATNKAHKIILIRVIETRAAVVEIITNLISLRATAIAVGGNLECGGIVPSHRDGDTALDQSLASTLLRIQSAVAAALCRRTPN